MSLEAVFLGTGGCIRVPTFNCKCSVCEEARRENTTRTRASLGLIGKETTIIDASPDLSSQLERESIRKIDNIFITHWHFDHVWGLAEIVEPTFMSDWKPVKVYLPENALPLYQQAMGYMSSVIDLQQVNPGDVIKTSFTSRTIENLGRLSKKTLPYCFVNIRLSRIQRIPLSCLLRISRPSPCFRVMTADGTW